MCYICFIVFNCNMTWYWCWWFIMFVYILRLCTCRLMTVSGKEVTILLCNSVVLVWFASTILVDLANFGSETLICQEKCIIIYVKYYLCTCNVIHASRVLEIWNLRIGNRNTNERYFAKYWLQRGRRDSLKQLIIVLVIYNLTPATTMCQ